MVFLWFSLVLPNVFWFLLVFFAVFIGFTLFSCNGFPMVLLCTLFDFPMDLLLETPWRVSQRICFFGIIGILNCFCYFFKKYCYSQLFFLKQCTPTKARSHIYIYIYIYIHIYTLCIVKGSLVSRSTSLRKSRLIDRQL